MSSKQKEMEKIKQEILDCKKCPLYKTRVKAVPGEGSLDAKIMLLGEAPGFNEAQQGRPFVGAAGKILDELLESVGIKRKSVFICNVLKCRPVTKNMENRAPKPEEIKACTPFLERQIEIIKPEIVATLGNYATKFILEKYGLKDQIQGISRLHGKVFKVKTLFQSVKIVPLYHPAVATYHPNKKKVLLEDFKILKNL